MSDGSTFDPGELSYAFDVDGDSVSSPESLNNIKVNTQGKGGTYIDVLVSVGLPSRFSTRCLPDASCRIRVNPKEGSDNPVTTIVPYDRSVITKLSPTHWNRKFKISRCPVAEVDVLFTDETYKSANITARFPKYGAYKLSEDWGKRIVIDKKPVTCNEIAKEAGYPFS